jgi:hypothetical protein
LPSVRASAFSDRAQGRSAARRYSCLAGSSATFTWTAGTGVTEYWLYAGTGHAGAANLYNTSATSSSANVTGLPTTGGTVYVRLLSKISRAWQYNDYTYTAQ